MLFLLVLILPFFYFAAGISLFQKNQRDGLLSSAISFLMLIVLGAWAILQSRSSTAAIGFLFLPGYASLAGTLTWLAVRHRKDSRFKIRIVSWLSLTLAIGLNVYVVVGGFKARTLNESRDKVQAERNKTIDSNRIEIRREISLHPSHEGEWLQQELQRHIEDELFLIPALESEYISAGALDELSQSEFGSVVLMVSRHPNTSGQTLETMSLKKDLPSYVFQEIAAHRNTPAGTLMRIYENQELRSSILVSLAKNPSTPRSLLAKIADTKDSWILLQIAKNPSGDCDLNRIVKKQVDGRNLQDIYKAAAELENRVEANLVKYCGQ